MRESITIELIYFEGYLQEMLLKIPCASFSSIMLVSQWIQVQVNVNGTKHS